MNCDDMHTAKEVIEELRQCKLRFHPTMELLYQSNPTLVPMRNFDIEIYLNHHYKVEEIRSIADADAETVNLVDMDAVCGSSNLEIENDVTPYLGPLNEQDSISIQDTNYPRSTLSTINISKTYRPNFSESSSNLVQITPAPSIKSSKTPYISNSKSAPYQSTWSNINVSMQL